jgi:hypothetical protein
MEVWDTHPLPTRLQEPRFVALRFEEEAFTLEDSDFKHLSRRPAHPQRSPVRLLVQHARRALLFVGQHRFQRKVRRPSRKSLVFERISSRAARIDVSQHHSRVRLIEKVREDHRVSRMPWTDVGKERKTSEYRACLGPEELPLSSMSTDPFAFEPPFMQIRIALSEWHLTPPSAQDDVRALQSYSAQCGCRW